jgi:hypothetical protein
MEPTKTGRSAPSGPSEQRKGSKRLRTDEVQPGSGELTPKHFRKVASR